MTKLIDIEHCYREDEAARLKAVWFRRRKNSKNTNTKKAPTKGFVRVTVTTGSSISILHLLCRCTCCGCY